MTRHSSSPGWQLRVCTICDRLRADQIKHFEVHADGVIDVPSPSLPHVKVEHYDPAAQPPLGEDT